ncbi:uncharacterized protein isoform X2 [Rhodnius prolixus]|uniref:uncharacterized protein isoform X2 n=1 Tax=Rhodnius prolixus TaxID=13249 RepID=UPI003D188C7E
MNPLGRRERKSGADLRKLEAAIDRLIKGTSQKLSNYSTGNYMVPLHFHSNNCTVSTSDTKIYFEAKSWNWQTNLSRRTVLLSIKLDNLSIDGDYKVDRLAYGDSLSTTTGIFRSTITDLHCDGVAALETGTQSFTLDWLHLFCNLSDSAIKTEIRPYGIILGNNLNKFMNEDFGTELEERLKNEVIGPLEEVASDSLKKKLERLPYNITRNRVLRSADYQSITEFEKLSTNDLMDGLLSIVAEIIRENHNDELPIPDIKEGFEKQLLHVVKLGAIFHATEGIARGVATLQRVGNARLQQMNHTVHFSGSVGFQKLQIYYGRYRAEVFGLGPGGSISTNVAPIAIRLRVRINFLTRRVFLDHLSITQVGRIQVRLRGLGWFVDRFLSCITNWVVAMFRDQILRLVEKRVTKYTRETLAKSTIDQLITGDTSI